MNRRAHILRTLADDPAATPGERAAALKALAIHDAKTSPAAQPEQPLAQPGEPVLMIWQDRCWSLTIGERVIGTWSGTCDVKIIHRNHDNYLGELYHHNKPDEFTVVASLTCGVKVAEILHNFVRRRRDPIEVVISEDHAAWLLTPAYCVNITSGPTHFRPSYDVELEIHAFGQSARFARASGRELPGMRALPEGR